MSEARGDQEVTPEDQAFADRVWGPGNWTRHMCSVNGEEAQMVIHSKRFHRTECSDEWKRHYMQEWCLRRVEWRRQHGSEQVVHYLRCTLLEGHDEPCLPERFPNKDHDCERFGCP